MTLRLTLVAILAACGSSSSATPDAAKADAMADAITNMADGGMACSSVTDVSTAVEQTRVADVLPTATGGTIADGTYTLTHWTLYTGAGGATGGTGQHQSMTTFVSGGGTVSHSAGTNAQGVAGHQTYTLAANGASITIMQTCPHIVPSISPLNQFTQSGTVVTLYSPSTSEAYEYTLMP